MSPRHVRVAAAVAALVLAPATVVLSASAGAFAVEALYSPIASRPERPEVDFSAVTSQAVPLTPDMVRELSRFFERSRREAAGGWSQAGAMDRALAAANELASKIADTPVADQAPDMLLPPPLTQTEQPPFALTLRMEAPGGEVIQAVSPLSYLSRSACDLAGQQWGRELERTATVMPRAMVICLSQAADLLAVRARLQATMPSADTVP